MASTEDGASAAAAARRRSGLQNPETATQTRRGRSPQPAESTPASAAEVNGRMSSSTGQRLSGRFAPTEFPQVHPQWACPVYRRFGRALVRALVCLLGTCRCHSLAFASACRCTVPCVASNGRADTPGRSKTPVQKERSHGHSREDRRSIRSEGTLITYLLTAGASTRGPGPRAAGAQLGHQSVHASLPVGLVSFSRFSRRSTTRHLRAFFRSMLVRNV